MILSGKITEHRRVIKLANGTLKPAYKTPFECIIYSKMFTRKQLQKMSINQLIDFTMKIQ